MTYQANPVQLVNIQYLILGLFLLALGGQPWQSRHAVCTQPFRSSGPNERTVILEKRTHANTFNNHATQLTSVTQISTNYTRRKQPTHVNCTLPNPKIRNYSRPELTHDLFRLFGVGRDQLTVKSATPLQKHRRTREKLRNPFALCENRLLPWSVQMGESQTTTN